MSRSPEPSARPRGIRCDDPLEEGAEDVERAAGAPGRGRRKGGSRKLRGFQPVAGEDDSACDMGEPRPMKHSHAAGAGRARDYVWLAVFVCSGIAIGQCFEILQVHAGPARYDTFFLSLLGYWSNFLVGAAWLLCTLGPRRAIEGFAPKRWSRRMLAALIGSAVLDGGAQGLNYIAQVEGGYMLFTIFQSSVTLFVCIIATLLLGARLRPMQWVGVLAIVGGLLLTSIPSPLVARHSFAAGLICSMVGSFCLASSYPLSEMVFRLAPREPPSPELACVAGSIVNVVFFSTWTLLHTLPQWDAAVVQPMRDARQPSLPWAIAGYGGFSMMVGLHSLAFWKSVCKLGTVPTAVSRGAQQAGVFVVAHLLFCRVDPTECLWNNGRGEQTLWSKLQKSAALSCCVAGVVLYTLGKPRTIAPDSQGLADAEICDAPLEPEVPRSGLRAA